MNPVEQNESELSAAEKRVLLEELLRRKAAQPRKAPIVARHDALRTNFLSARGGPIQVISGARKIEIEIIDLRTSGSRVQGGGSGAKNRRAFRRRRRALLSD